jgi:hypothetical protein
MDNSLKESYRIGKILRKLTGIKFLKSKQTSQISQAGRHHADEYLQKKNNTGQSRSKSDVTSPSPTHEDKYLRYQKELEASKLLGGKSKPKSPGRIPKLTAGRKEIMSTSEE